MEKFLVYEIAVLSVLALFVLLTWEFMPNRSLSSFPVKGIMVANKSWNVYVAINQAQQEQGYMYQHTIGNCNGKRNCLGMLFPMQTNESICMWMHNTPIPLYQYWINSNAIVYAYNGMPFSDQVVCHYGIAVLETNKTLPIGTSVYISNN